MNVRYEQKDELTFIGYHTEIRREEGYAKCPKFWDREYMQKYARLWQTMTPENDVERAILDNGIGMYALCADGENSFTYWIAGLYKGGPVPEGLELCTFPAGKWAVFTAKGPIPASLQALNTALWQEWVPTEGRRCRAKTSVTVEFYSDADPRSADYESGIWMPVEAEPGEFIAFCGLDCESCEARLATVNDDEGLRDKVAKAWSALNGVEITPEMIHCVGCRIDGVKTPFCESLCPIRQCALGKGVETCGGCEKMRACEKLSMITGNNADALRRLENM